MEPFDRAVMVVLELEGGLSDHPWDDGGKTRYGISSAAHPDVDLDILTIEDAKEIYRQHYWQPVCAESMNPGLGLVMFDGAVNHGVRTMVKRLQHVVGVKPDGHFGPVTLGAVQHAQRDDLMVLIGLVIEERYDIYLGHEDVRHFGKGWRNRMRDIRKKAREWA